MTDASKGIDSMDHRDGTVADIQAMGDRGNGVPTTPNCAEIAAI
jgi:hypothetical protein